MKLSTIGRELRDSADGDHATTVGLSSWGLQVEAVVKLAERILAGDQRAIARGISIVESESADAAVLVSQLFSRAGKARVVGVTGAPGVGKSTLVDALATEWRREGFGVGIIAVDPTSPFSGGAILGDRIRMQAHAGDAGVYVRSMATRGHLGGLSHATGDAIVILDASGKDVVLIETVGVGQGEIEIARTADTSIVVTVPGTGDDIQALKAGIMEIGDIFVVNKSDRDGADRAVADIQGMLALKAHEDVDWHPPILKTQATIGYNVTELLETVRRLEAKRGHSVERRRERLRSRLYEILRRRFSEHLESRTELVLAVDGAVEKMLESDLDPYTAAEEILAQVLHESRDS